MGWDLVRVHSLSFNLHLTKTPSSRSHSHLPPSCQLPLIRHNASNLFIRNAIASASFNGKHSVSSLYQRRLSAFTAYSSATEAKSTTSTKETTPKKVLVPIAMGTEEMEAVIIIDILRRAGAHVTVASVERELQVQASLQVNIVADTLISTCAEETFDLVVLPGGMPGSARLRDSKILKTITREQADAGRLYGAISAAPAITLDAWDMLTAVQVTVHPAFSWKLSSFWTVASNVHNFGFLTTSRGPGTAMEFALSFVEQLYGKKKSEAIKKDLVMQTNGGSELKRQEYNAIKWAINKSPRVLLPVANGSEEMEAVIIIDILRRARADVVVASVEERLEIVGSRNVKLVADELIEDAAASVYDLIILPGGIPGAERLQRSEPLRKLLREQALSKRVYGAICASPVVVLETLGLLKGKKATAHPSFSRKLIDQSAVNASVVIDGKLITSRGPGTAIEFSMALVDKFYGKKRAKSVADGIVFDYS